MADFIADTTTLLERTPAVLRTLLIGLPEVWTDTPDVADGWRTRGLALLALGLLGTTKQQ